MNRLKLGFAGLAVAASAGLTSITMLAMAPAAHASVPTQRTRTVATHDLDLRSANARATLDGRVRRAAERLCSDRTARLLSQRKVGRVCILDTVARAAPQVERAIVRDRAAAESTAVALAPNHKQN